MPYSRDEVIEKRKANRAAVSIPYSQTGRKSRKAGWTPSIWNALAFWKTGGASSQEEEEEEEGEEDAPPGGANGHGASGSGSTDKLNGGMIGFSDVEDSDANTSMSSTLSEVQVASILSMQSPRHVRFNLPSHNQERLNARQLQPSQSSRSQPETPVEQSPRSSYVAPIPPSSPLHRNSSPHKDPLSQVSDYIDHVILPRDGKANYVEALGLTTLIQEGTYKAQMEAQTQYSTPSRSSPFLISASASASSSVSPSPPPIRPTFTRPDTDIAAVFAASFTPPDFPSASSFPSPSSPSTSTSTSGRTLARNPNGSLYYQGGGSSRSRYRSPSFGTPPSKKRVAFPRGFGDGQKESPKMNGVVNGSPGMSSPSDGKRRRVGEERDTSTAQGSGSTPPMTNGATSPTPNTRSNGPPPSVSNLRFGTLPSTSRFMASTPARPSPLRQSMRADSSSPSTASPGSEIGASPRITNGGGDSPSRSRASEKASEIMAGIINDATPKKDPIPDVRNPYQSPNRSPTKRTRKPAVKAPRPPPRPTRQTSAPTPQSSEPKKLSALETIQRTAPQAGSKRSHTGMPPPTPPSANGIHTRPGSSQAGMSAQKPLVIEIDEDDEEEEQAKRPPTKKQKQVNERPREGKEKISQKEWQKQASIDVEDVDMDTPASVEKVERPSEVIEPDQQQQQETKRPVLPSPFGSKKGPTARFQSVPKEPSPLRQSFQPDAPSSPPKESTNTTSFSFGQASALSPMPSPFGHPTSASSTTGSAPALDHSKSIPAQAPAVSAPALSALTSAFASPPAAATPTDWLAVARKQVTEAPAHTLPTFTFVVTRTFTLGEYEAQRKAALAVPVSELPMFDFSTPPVRVSPPKTEVKAFDWDGAGFKRTVVTDKWTCGLCGLANPHDAVECTICGSSKV